jgi:hypothetical protein
MSEELDYCSNLDRLIFVLAKLSTRFKPLQLSA